jgi:hypothetical protein
VGVGDETLEHGPIGGPVKVQLGAPLAGGHVWHEGRNLREARRVYPKHVRSVGRQQSRTDRAGDNPGQVEHSDPAQRPAVARIVIESHRCAGPAGAQRADRLAESCPARLGAPPGLGVVQHGGTATGGDDGVLQPLACPAGDGLRDLGPRRHLSEYQLDRGPMVGVIGVQPDPAVGAPVVARDRVPGGRPFPSLRREECLAQERRARRAPVDRHLGRRTAVACRRELGHGQARHRDRRGRQPGHVED